jgi:hypothetical protein
MTKALLFRVAPHNRGLVFATKERAEYVAKIHEAINTSETWAEFRSAVPRKEYLEILAIFDGNGEKRPKGTGPFDGEQLPGWSDGDYPPWLQQEMTGVIPKSILQQFGTLRSSVLNGPYWEIPEKNGPDVVRCLRELGFHVEEAAALEFH